MKILHIGGCDKFLPPFIELIKENFDFEQHEFLLHSGMGKAPDYPNVKVYERKIIERLKFYIVALFKMHSADKVILHGLFDIKLVFILFFTPWLLRKCYWAIWGGDLYVHQLGERNWKWKIKEFFRRPVIRKIGHLISSTEGDVRRVREWYGSKGKYYECLMYVSNLYQEHNLPTKQNSATNIQIGNSADPSNNHLEALQKLLPYKDQNITIYVPLSYGNKEHAAQVIQKGKEWFGDKLKPMTEYLPFDKYLEFLSTIDIAIFNHNRQQAMGNITTLLGLGKKVYINSDVSSHEMFIKKEIVVFDTKEGVSLDNLNIEKNREIIKKEFSKERLIETIAEIVK